MKKKHLSPLFEAYLFAEKAHRGVFRKGSDEPYMNHPVEVCLMIQRYARPKSYDINTLVTALLHDTFEDTDVTLEQITELFGADVAVMVHQVSKVSKKSDGNREVRKNLDLAHYAAAEPRAQTVKVADVRSNTRDVVDMDVKFAKLYLPEQRAKLDVLTKADPDLRAAAYKTLEKAENKLKELLQSA